jgi:anaerobic selenocysteine-containing dehydrogenase
MHPQDAKRLGLVQGALAQLSAQGTTLCAPVDISEDMMPGVVSLPHGWGHDLPGSQLQVAAIRPGVNLNALLSDSARDPLSGNAVLSGVPVQVSAMT